MRDDLTNEFTANKLNECRELLIRKSSIISVGVCCEWSTGESSANGVGVRRE